MRLLVVGARKCATTWLHKNLSLNPELRFSPKVKESGFFSEYFDRGLAWYQSLFDRLGEGLYAEVDTSLLRSKVAPRNVKASFPDAKIVVLIRKPREHFRSSYLHAKRKGDLNIGASAAWRNHGEFADELEFDVHVSRWLKYFSEKQLLIIFFEAIQESPKQVIETVSQFAGVRPVIDDDILTEKMNVARSARFNWLTRFVVLAARTARNLGVHGLVNFAKGLVPQKLLYRSEVDEFRLDREIEAELEDIERRQLAFFDKLQTVGTSDLWSAGYSNATAR